MHFLRTILFLSLVTYVSCCGKGRKKGIKGPAGPAGPDGGNVIQRMVGNDVVTDPYTASGDDPQKTCDALNYNGDGGGCWTNNAPPQDQIQWVHGSGAGEPAKMQTSFGTSTGPEGGYLITASETAGTAEQTAQLYSCPIQCAQGDVTVKLKHWQSSGTHIEVCSTTDPGTAPSNCKPLPQSSGNQDSVTIPGGQGTRVVILARGFTAPAGTVAIIDDITVECTPCPDTTPAPPPPSAAPPPPPPPPPAAAPPCKEINCDFEGGNPCSYSTASSSGSATDNWGVRSAPYQNPLTGVKKTNQEQGQKFAACYLKKKAEKTTMTTSANFDKEYVVCCDYYKATEGVNLKICCDSDSNCPFDTTPDVQVSHYKNWRKACVQCPSGTKQVLFVSENQKGESEGAVGVDNIKLMQPSGGSPDAASQPACT